MLRPTIVLVTLAAAAAALGAAAPAATSAADPSRLVLARSDFPSTAKYTWNQMPAYLTQGFAEQGVKAKGAYYAVQFPRGSAGYKSVSGMVVTTGSAAQARTVYAGFRTQQRLGGQKTVIRLAAHGDQQIALFQSPKFGSKVQLLVRRNTVVWQLEVSGEGLLVIPKATLIAELEKYAAKQKRRVGGG